MNLNQSIFETIINGFDSQLSNTLKKNSGSVVKNAQLSQLGFDRVGK